MKKILFILLSLGVTTMAHAQEDGLSTYQFLRLPVSAHAAALGGDNISLIEDDENLIFSNPALLSSVSDKTLSLSYMTMTSGVKTAGVAFNRVVKERASWAVTGQFVDYGKMKQVDERDFGVGTFSARDIAVSGYFSYLLGKYFSGGLSAKLISSQIGQYNSWAFGVDLGLNYYHPDRQWSASFVIKNLGGQLKAYHEDFERMPVDVQLGTTKRFGTSPFRLSLTLVDLNHLNYRFVDHVVLGAEALLSEHFWLGTGYNFRRAREMRIQTDERHSSSHGAGWSFGAGANFSRIKINVAYGKYHVSNSSVVMNLAYSF